MRLFWASFATIVCGFSSPAESLRLEGHPFTVRTNCEVKWKAETNGLPSGLWIYKVMPEAFSGAVVSNAMKLGQFQMRDLSKSDQPLLQDKHLIYFQNKNEYGRSRYLFIAPTVGAMDYTSQKDYKAPVEDVPSPEETERMARDVLFQLGIDRSLLSDKVRRGWDETTTKIDRKGNRLNTEQTTVRGISFERKIDGIPLSEAWCFLIHFGSHGRIEDFKLTWRNILPFESHRLLTSSQIRQMIESGKSVFPPQVASRDELDNAKSLTVVKMTPRYYNGSGTEWKNFLYPYADLEMQADLGEGNKSIFYLQCPITGEKTP